MHSTVAQTAIATAQHYIVQTPQRRANYNDKTRLKRKELKARAFDEYGCKSTAEIKKLLKMLGIKLDLRLTAAWNAIVFELRSRLLSVCLKPEPQIKPGVKVEWVNYPPLACYIAQWFPLKVLSIEKDMAQVELWSKPIPVSELVLAC